MAGDNDDHKNVQRRRKTATSRLHFSTRLPSPAKQVIIIIVAINSIIILMLSLLSSLLLLLLLLFQPLRAFRRTVHREQRRGELL